MKTLNKPKELEFIPLARKLIILIISLLLLKKLTFF